jgi:acyl CoA:acetate/3-ketoacid CoA transferase alpha subunit
VEIEGEIIDVGGMDPNNVHTPGIFVDQVIKIPPAPEGLWTLPSDRGR